MAPEKTTMNHSKTSIGGVAAMAIITVVVLALLAYLAAQALLLTGKAIDYAAGTVADRQAESECIQWAVEAKRHTPYSEANPGGYYLTQWQKEECDSVNIHIEAPVI